MVGQRQHEIDNSEEGLAILTVDGPAARRVGHRHGQITNVGDVRRRLHADRRQPGRRRPRTLRSRACSPWSSPTGRPRSTTGRSPTIGDRRPRHLGSRTRPHTYTFTVTFADGCRQRVPGRADDPRLHLGRRRRTPPEDADGTGERPIRPGRAERALLRDRRLLGAADRRRCDRCSWSRRDRVLGRLLHLDVALARQRVRRCRHGTRRWLAPADRRRRRHAPGRQPKRRPDRHEQRPRGRLVLDARGAWTASRRSRQVLDGRGPADRPRPAGSGVQTGRSPASPTCRSAPSRRTRSAATGHADLAGRYEVAGRPGTSTSLDLRLADGVGPVSSETRRRAQATGHGDPDDGRPDRGLRARRDHGAADPARLRALRHHQRLDGADDARSARSCTTRWCRSRTSRSATSSPSSRRPSSASTTRSPTGSCRISVAGENSDATRASGSSDQGRRQRGHRPVEDGARRAGPGAGSCGTSRTSATSTWRSRCGWVQLLRDRHPGARADRLHRRHACGGSPATASARSARNRRAAAEQAGDRAVRRRGCWSRSSCSDRCSPASGPGPRSPRSPRTSRTPRPHRGRPSADHGQTWSPSRGRTTGSDRHPDPVRPAAAQPRRERRSTSAP